MTKYALSFALMSLCAAPAFAEDPFAFNRERSESVRHADLNLASDAGVAELDRRITHAVRRVCGRAEQVDLEATADLHACRVAATRQMQRLRSNAIAAATQPAATVLASADPR